MATRLKTVCYAWPIANSVPDSTPTSLGTITLYIPETTRTFKSVYLETSFQDAITATGGTVSEQSVDLVLGGAAPLSILETDDITHSGEQVAGVTGPWDLTAYFVSDFGGGASQTCQVSLGFVQSTGTTLGMVNCTAMIYITYEYDDAASTQVKTVIIPMESPASSIPISETEIGTNQIPQLTSSGFLPESTVTIRDYFFVIEGNNSLPSGTTDWILTGRIDSEGGGGTSIGTTVENAQASASYLRWIWSRTSTYPSTTAAHQFKMWATASATRLNHACITLYVTYEFDPSATTRVINSVILPIEFSSPLGLDSADHSRYSRNFFIEEPGTITFRQSAFRIHFNAPAAIAGLNFRAGGQSYRAYTHASSNPSGMYSLQQRLDSGSAQGAGVTIARGDNTIFIDGYRTDTTDDPTNVTGFIVLNYESDKHGDGVGAHSKTVFWGVSYWDASLVDRLQVSFNATIPESNYFLTAVGYVLTQWVAIAANAVTFDIQCLSGEGKGGGYYDVYTDAYQGTAERSMTMIWCSARDIFKTYPTDPGSDKINLETSRVYRLFNPSPTAQGVVNVFTYHTMTYDVEGSIVGYTGNGSGIVVDVHRSDNDSLVGTVTSSTGGTYAFEWYDNVVPVYAHARQADGYVGRSNNGLAV